MLMKSLQLIQLRDLNHLCCTCKTLTTVVLPTLHHTIELKIPLRWSGLPSLENLLASSSEGFKYTRCLSIVTKHYGQKDNKYSSLDMEHETNEEDFVENEEESEDEGQAESDDSEEEEEGGGEEEGEEEEEEEEEEDGGVFQLYHPADSASNTLNAFIRVLIVKFPQQQLHTFWYTASRTLCDSILQ